MNKTVGIRKAASILREAENVLIFTHERPDFDTVGSALALKYILNRLGKKADIACSDALPERFSIITDELELRPAGKYDTVVSVDMAARRMLGRYEEEYGDLIDLSIDHHKTNNYFAKYTYCRPEASAAGEIIFDLSRILGVKQDKTLAKYLYCAISSDSGCFKFSSVSPKTHRIAAELLTYVDDHAYLDRVMIDARTRGQLALEALCLETLRYFAGGRIAIMTVTLEMCEKSGADVADIDALVQIPRTVEGVEVGVTLKEQTAGNFKVSLRSNEYFDCSDFAQIFGGGGHARASGFSVEGDPAALVTMLAAEAEKRL